MGVNRKAAGFAVSYGVTMLVALLALRYRRRQRQHSREVSGEACRYIKRIVLTYPVGGLDEREALSYCFCPILLWRKSSKWLPV